MIYTSYSEQVKTLTVSYTSGSGGVMIYKIEGCSIGSASIDFDIEGIAQVAWSGNGKLITEQATLNTAAGQASTKGLINEGISVQQPIS